MKNIIHKFFGFLLLKHYVKKENLELYEYAFVILISTIIHISISIAIGLILNMIWESFFMFISFFVMRKVTGGFHLNRFWMCTIFSLVVNIISLHIISMLIDNESWYLYFLLLISFLSVPFLSPIESPQKPLSGREKTMLKKMSIVLCLILSILSIISYNYINCAIGLSLCIGIVIDVCFLYLSRLILIFKKVL